MVFLPRLVVTAIIFIFNSLIIILSDLRSCSVGLQDNEANNPVYIVRQATGLKGSMDTLLDEADTDGDGRISLPEFQKLLRQASLGSRNNSEHQAPPAHHSRRREAQQQHQHTAS